MLEIYVNHASRANTMGLQRPRNPRNPESEPAAGESAPDLTPPYSSCRAGS